MDSLAPLIEGTRRPQTTELLPRVPVLPKLKAGLSTWLRRWHERLSMMLESAAQEPNTLTGRIATQLREPRGVRIALTALIILVLAVSLLVFARRTGDDESRYQAVVAAGTVQAYQQYLQDCPGCKHRADAQAARDKLQKAAAVTVLEDQFKELLAKQQLMPPANPNASGVLQILESSAPDDAYIPQAKSELVAALKAAPATAPAQAKKAKTKPVERRVAKGQPKPKAKPTAPFAQPGAVVAAANEVLPKPIFYPAPKYPQAGKGQSGWVDLEFMVNVDGSTSSMSVVGSSPKGLFDAAAMHAVHNWIYQPDTIDGVRHPKRIRLRVEFKP